MAKRNAKGSASSGSSLRSAGGDDEDPSRWDERLHQEGHPTRRVPTILGEPPPRHPHAREEPGRLPGGKRGRGRFDAPQAAGHERALVGPPPLAADCGVLFLDHRKARLIRRGDPRTGSLAIRRFRGLAEGRPRSTGHAGSVAPGQPGGNPQKHRRGYEEALLQRYYDRIIAALGECERIVIAGPGPAKLELRRRLQHEPAVERRIQGVLAVDGRIGDRELLHACGGLFAAG
jgi:hypothetical protein